MSEAEAQAPTVVPLAPPQTDGGTTLRESLERGGFQAEIDYLPEGAPLDAIVRQARPEPGQREPFNPFSPPQLDLADWLTLAALLSVIAALVYLGWRKGLFATGRDRAFKSSEEMPAFMADADGADPLGADDPREGMRRLLAQALTQAARTTGLRLSRAWTSRDILARIPETFGERERLAALVLAAEPVVFGGREIDAPTLAAHARRAASLLPAAGRG